MTAPKPKRGRPRRTNKLATARVAIRVTPGERAVLETAAKRDNAQDLSAWVRSVLFRAAGLSE